MNEIALAYITNTLDKIALNKPINVSNEQLVKLNWQFEIVPGFTLTITNEKQQLYVQATGQPKLMLTAISATEFVNRALKAKIVFKINTQGEAQSLTMYQAGQKLPGIKL